ncbi:hypothetical protein [Rhizobium oryzicola]|uniref:Uncharacterized protein n=1 Tax=Rhizobium oryzicola TaxID=1232668 RepID=A0ABT8SQB3_9HYPH|nr:hypothetical protein [Rhizobium oryzicola]MDO1580675.1 hypothetical protein [Rhizobium oryzicola]
MYSVRFLLVGPASFIDDETAAAWAQAEITLEGPVTPDRLTETLSGDHWDGAIVDVRYDADTLLNVIELFDKAAIPALFASPASFAAQQTGGYILSSDPADIESIVGHLAEDGKPTLH